MVMTRASAKLNVDKLRAPMEQTHASRVHLTYEWRMQQLRALKKVLTDHKDEWVQALQEDLGKEPYEGLITEMLLCEMEANYLMAHLKEWMKDQAVPGPVHNALGFNTVSRRPLTSPGVLMIAPFNYPVHLAILPALGALCGGNPVLLKPSEHCPATSALLQKLIGQHLEPGAMQVVTGGVPETTALLEYGWGMIFFTGSQQVGKIVAEAAAKTLTPTVLEMGGKSPVWVDPVAPSDMEGMSNRIIWGKTLNAGQTCLAPDYLVVHQKHADKLCEELLKSIERQFTKNVKTSEFGRIVTPSHAKRHIQMLQEAEKSPTTRILCGGSKECNADERYVPPTLVLNPPKGCRLLREEIFGPILPIVIVETREEGIDFINSMPGTPLAIYVFTKSHKIYTSVIDACPAASGLRNDVMMQCSASTLPFGGLGSSGWGNYHGKYSFETFTHAFPHTYRPCAPGLDFNLVRYHPYNTWRGPALEHVLLKLPLIPVLHSRFWMIVLGIGAMLIYVPAAQPIQSFLGDTVASLLEAVAGWIRRSSSESQ